MSGYFFISMAVFFNGTFGVPFKYAASSMQLHPAIFQFYAAVGVFLSSWLSQCFLPLNSEVVDGASNSFEFVSFALIAGGLFVCSVFSAFQAFERLGLALAQGIIGGSAVLISFFWGVVVFGETPRRPSYAGSGLVLILAGVFGIAFCQNFAAYIDRQLWPSDSSRGVEEALLAPITDDKSNLEDASDRQEEGKNEKLSIWHWGVVWAFLTGSLGGSILVPLHYVGSAQQGLVFLPSFGCGAIIVSPLIVLAVCVSRGAWSFGLLRSLPQCHVRETMAWGVFSGVLWNINNVFAIAAIPLIGYSLAFPLSQCSIFVSGMWGIFLFKEIRGTAVGAFFAGSLVLTAGAVLLSLGA